MSRHVIANRAGRRRFSPLLIGAGVAAAVALSMSFSGTLSAYTASFVHPDNTVSTASISIAETSADGSNTTCGTDSSGTATCRTANLYSGQTLSPGDTKSTTVTFKNTGSTTPQRFALTGGACTTSPASSSVDLCDKVVVSLKWRNADVLPASTTPKSLAGTTTVVPNPPAPTEVLSAVVTVTLPADTANSTSGLSLSQPLTWTFTA
ncbi:hypothetical protein [Curtobacterium sp. MWU13-2055]|uniref:hypothetical protein n=1 Tax=Curtobacterium sp. MWU13-2055 TaxID=2931928 RepID=UPI00200C263E|nr:hypothetical protein [Curtobacterium sp. MWU13-2055]